MKNLNQYILEKLKGSTLNKNSHGYHPETKEEPKQIIEERLKKDKDADLNDIDVSNITDMSELFFGLDVAPQNIDISLWDVLNVTNMSAMFKNCENFNCDLSEWDVSNVINMHNTFSGCDLFEGNGLEKWNVSNVKDMSHMFYECPKFKINLSKWDVSNVIDMDKMFANSGLRFTKDRLNWYK